MRKVKLISIEGIEGAGKSTAIQFVKELLQEARIPVVLTREPGGTILAERIRELLLHPGDEKMAAETELLLMFAARAQHLQGRILPALASGQWVITDRFIDASYAYQGSGRDINHHYIDWLDQWIVGTHYPDLTFLLDIDPVEGCKRAEKRGAGKDRIEREKIEFFNHVRKAYLLRAEQDPKRIKIIDAHLPWIIVQQQIRDILKLYVEHQ